MNKSTVAITPENARELFINASSAFARSEGGSQQRLLAILKTRDSNVRDALATCANEEDVIGAFIYACSYNAIDLLELFYEIGMNVNVKDQCGNTPLIGATNNSQKISVRWLLKHDADVDITNKNGWTPLMCASWSGETNAVKMLLQKNANPDIQNIKGRTALMYASANGRKEIIQLLLNHNVDIELRDNEGKTASDLAANEEIKEMLLNHVNTSFVLK